MIPTTDYHELKKRMLVVAKGKKNVDLNLFKNIMKLRSNLFRSKAEMFYQRQIQDNRLKADAENKLRQLFKKRENNTDAVNITSEEESGHFSGNVIRRKNQLIRDGRNKKSA